MAIADIFAPPQRDHVQVAPIIDYQDGAALVWYAPRIDDRGVPASAAAPARQEQLTHLQIAFSATSVAVAAKLQLGSIFNVDAEVEGKAIFYDAVATTDYYEEATDPDGAVLYAVRHGIGARLALKARKLSIETNLSYAMVAAQARAATAEVFYELQGVGIAPSILQSMLGALRLHGPLDDASYAKLDHVLCKQLPDYLEDPSNPLTPTDYVVVPRAGDSGDTTVHARVCSLAMTYIGRGRRITDALNALASSEDLDTEASRFLVKYTYSKYADITDPASTAKPSQAAINRAMAWLNV